MNNRDRLREHFELASGPMPPSLEADVRRRLAAPPSDAGLHWTLGAVAALLAVLAIGVLLYSSASNRRAVPASTPRPAVSASPSWNATVPPELVPPVGAPVCGATIIDYVVTPTPPPASVSNLAIEHSATGDAVFIGIGGGYPSRVQAHLLADGSAYVVNLYGTTAAGRQGLTEEAGPIHSIQLEDPNADGTHRAAILRVTVTGLSCVRVVPGAQSITLEFSSGG